MPQNLRKRVEEGDSSFKFLGTCERRTSLYVAISLRSTVNFVITGPLQCPTGK
jgi:hypothetical protein